MANELGAGNGKGAKFATIVSTTTSFLIGLFFSALALAFHDMIALVFSSSNAVIDAVDNISFLLAVTILLNGVQPVLSGTFWYTLHTGLQVQPHLNLCAPVNLQGLLLVQGGKRQWPM